MIRQIYKAFLNWRGDKEVCKLGIATEIEKFRANNWKFKDYYNEEKSK